MYKYEDMKPKIFTEEGSVLFTKTRDNVKRLLKLAGAVRCDEAMVINGASDSWTMLACVDRLVGLGEIREIKQPNRVAGQHRIFVKA